MKTIGAMALAVVLSLSVGGVSEAQGLQKLRIGYPSISSRQGQLWIAKDEGLFKKYGLEVELIFLRGGQVAIQALASGDPPSETSSSPICKGTMSFWWVRLRIRTTRSFSSSRSSSWT